MTGLPCSCARRIGRPRSPGSAAKRLQEVWLFGEPFAQGQGQLQLCPFARQSTIDDVRIFRAGETMSAAFCLQSRSSQALIDGRYQIGILAAQIDRIRIALVGAAMDCNDGAFCFQQLERAILVKIL
ncbi:hypothetical protein X766_08905 [Mesorhizobium sp. LSJC255A00]|nr:hypothetical protein X766_08905 [Mesorhizobium sp. LSJC255A00]ESX78434.1 hypothetical protein X757_08115 [Mesorhizobium sp. LSHC414A00]